MPVMALLPVVAGAPGGAQAGPLAGGFCRPLVAVGSHLLLDSTNAYGIRLLLPFSGDGFGWTLPA